MCHQICATVHLQISRISATSKREVPGERERERDEDGGEMCGTEIGVCHMGRLGLVRGKQKKHLGEIVEEWGVCDMWGRMGSVGENKTTRKRKKHLSRRPSSLQSLRSISIPHTSSSWMRLRRVGEGGVKHGSKTAQKRLKNGLKNGLKPGSNPAQTQRNQGSNTAQIRLKHGLKPGSNRAQTRVRCVCDAFNGSVDRCRRVLMMGRWVSRERWTEATHALRLSPLRALVAPAAVWRAAAAGRQFALCGRQCGRVKRAALVGRDARVEGVRTHLLSS